VPLAVAVAAPVLAAIALATTILWVHAGADSAGVSLVAAVAALIASGWAILVAPSRALRALGIASLVTASIALVLWWQEVAGILKTT
jgi:hypothetical protein